MHTQDSEKTSGIHIVPTIERKFPGHQAYRIHDKIQYDLTGKKQCKTWGGEIHLCHTQEFILVEEIWYSEMGKSGSQSLPFTDRLRHGTLL